MRILVDIPTEDLGALKRLSVARKVSRAELVRTAVSAYLLPHRSAETSEAFGLWGTPSVEDGDADVTRGVEGGLSYQERLRSEW